MMVCDLTEVCKSDRPRAITDELRGLTASADLAIVQGYPLFTQTFVGCFFDAASTFEKYDITRPDPDYGHALVFYDYASDDGRLGALDRAKGLLVPEDNDHSALVSWLPITVPMEQNAYPEIMAVNNTRVVYETGPVLDSL